ncbi:hypothetical protein ACGFR8_31250 [Streptomyces brevispora]|uniref:hypothetical protein n=1 Tax=Streptomyces brevispora TaxID=887462 RepID=UPI00371418A5
MKDGDWFLGYSGRDDLPGAGLTFGRFRSGIYCLKEPSIAFADPDVGDQPLPGEDGVRLGLDYQRSVTVTMELGIDTVNAPADRTYPRKIIKGRVIGDWPDEPHILELLKRTGNRASWNADGIAMMRQVWRADSVRAGAGRVAWLRHRKAGRTRFLFGRPRRFAEGGGELSSQGYTPVVADFVAIDDKFLDVTEKTATLWEYPLRYMRPVPGRVISHHPIEPWDPGNSRRTASIVQAGQLSTYPIITIHGPCANPKITLTDRWAVQLALTLKSGEYVTIDARSFARTVVKYLPNGSYSSVAHKLTRASPRLAEMTIPPGTWHARLDYTRTTTAQKQGPRVEIIWRDAFAGW